MMPRTVINIDEQALKEAALELGTKTKVETVNAALREVANRRKVMEFIDALASGEIDLSEENLRGAWR